MKKLLLVFVFLAAFATLFAIPQSAYAATDPLQGACAGSGSASATCKGRTTNDPLLGPSGVLTKVVQIIVMATAVIAVIMIMIGGFKYMISNGDSANINSAKNTILYAIVGLVVAVIGQSIVSFVLVKL